MFMFCVSSASTYLLAAMTLGVGYGIPALLSIILLIELVDYSRPVVVATPFSERLWQSCQTSRIRAIDRQVAWSPIKRRLLVDVAIRQRTLPAEQPTYAICLARGS